MRTTEGRQAAAAAEYARFEAALAAELGSQDELLGFSFGYPAAYRRSYSGFLGFLANPPQWLLHTVKSALAARRHIGGAPGSLARQLPRDTGAGAIVLSRAAVTQWTFGTMRQDFPPRRQVLVPRDKITSIREVTSTRHHWTARLTFHDGSYFDFTVVSDDRPRGLARAIADS